MTSAYDTLHTALLALERTGLAELVRGTPFLYPILMSLHVLGIALLLGPTVAVDLRLLGVARDAVRVSTATRHLLPLAHIGFVLVACTGATMFIAIAAAVGASAAAPWKLGLIVLAGLNIAVFHRGIYRHVERWDIGVPTPARARLAGLLSMACWTGVVFAGRFLAY
ncbi:hypothetical protein [Bordetella genomosp. 5]|uniref:DUF2214 domain-containing protein n=1 Tax=Bordetella genomosp. 5 TaxID=1395608 RepID=A0A261TWB1_9BORD|nr:hypothetical protein [Bordetella genomosp. 5]OZI53956.1 hypothetical protein CAL25_06375 [Bordetella genomosp. 5]